MKSAGRGTSLRKEGEPKEQEATQDTQEAQTERAAPMRKASGAGEDARSDPRKQRDNQKRMGVAADHRTVHMEKRKRGTFP